MSFWSKISENKLAVIFATAGIALSGAVYWAYREYNKQEEGKVEVEIKEFDLDNEIHKLKAEVNLGNPSLEDVKKIFSLLAEYVKSKTIGVSGKYKAERRKRFPKEIRYSRIPEYFKETAESLVQIQNTLMKLQNEQGQIMASFGLTQASLARYAAQLGPFMQQLQMKELDFNGMISIEKTKLYLKLKTEFLQNHGERLVQALIQLASSISPQEKQLIPVFMNTFINDEVFEHQPDLDREEFQIAAQQYRNQLTSEIINYEKVLMPLMGKLQAVLAGGQMPGYGGFGQGYENSMAPGYSEEAMQQQLEALRLQDPQAYEQIVSLMQAQMGR